MPSPGTPIPAADVNLAQQRNVAASLVGVTDLTAATYASESVVESQAFPVIAGRKYRVSYVWHAQASSTTNLVYVRIRENNTTGAQLTYVQHQVPTTIDTKVTWVEWTAGVSGNQTFAITAQRLSGSTNTQFRGASSQPRILSVERLGQYA